MKKSINKYISIVTLVLFIMSFVFNAYAAYENYIKAESDYMQKSINFLSSQEENIDFEPTIKDFAQENKNISIAYSDLLGKEIFLSNNFDKELYNKINKANKEQYIEKNIFKSTIFLYEKSESGRLILLKHENVLKKLNYFNFKYYFFVFMLVTIINNLLIGKIIDKGLRKLKLNIDKKEDVLQSRIFDIKNITDNMQEGFLYFNNKGVMRVINEAAKKMLDLDKTYRLESLFDSEEYKYALKSTKYLSKAKNIDIRVKEKDIKLFIDPIFDGQGFSYIILAIDNSENKKAEQMRREFSANVSHELKSPLTSINGYAELIATGFAKDEDIGKFAQIINKEGNRLLDIIDDILKLSKLDEKNFDKNLTSVNVRQVCDNCIKKFLNLTEKNSISIENKVEDFSIKTKESLFVDLITNIYENAIKYNKEGGKISLSSKKDGDSYYLSIADTGIGIKNDDLERIFERFYVVDKSRTRTMKSTGLGLSIVKHICEYLNYDIEVTSKYQEGTTFTLKINQ